jgi:hypothetical protein
MIYQISEIQNKDVTRVYNIEGPQIATIVSFWEWLKQERIIENYSITEREG